MADLTRFSALGAWLSCLLLACSDRTPVAPVSTLFATAAIPVYTKFAEIEDLFGQRNDTTYLVNFWATWCKPCLEELPMLSELQHNYQDRPLRVLLISLDTQSAAIERIPDYLSGRGIDLATIVLTDTLPSWQRQLDEHWSGELPTSIIYRNELRYVYRRNFMTLPDAEAAVSPLLGK